MKNVFMRDNNYHIRKHIPKYARIYFNNKSMFIRSMKTKNKAHALKFSKLLLKKFNYILESINMGMDENLIKDLVYELTNLRLEETESDLYNTANPEDTTFYLLLDDTITSYQKCYATSDYSIVNDDVKQIVSKLDISVKETDLNNISKVLLDSHINNLKKLKQNIESNKYSKPKPTSVKTHIISTNIDRLEVVFSEYVENTKVTDKWSQDTLKLNVLVGELLSLYFTKDKDVTTITNRDLLEFRNILFKLPSKLKQRNQFKNKDLDYIVNNSDGIDKLTINTINKYIIRVNQFFNYCLKMDYISKQVSLEKVKDDSNSKREQYNKTELVALKNLMLNESDENKFIVFAMMYQGMRLKEVTQLVKNDIKLIDGIYCIDINDDDIKTLKTKNSKRVIPINQKLLDLGFIDYVNSKTENLFEIDNKKFSEYYRKNINKLVTQNINKTLYSLRHNFINHLVQNDVRAEHVASIAGHTQEFNITMNTYANKINVTLLKEIIDKVNY